MSFTRHGNYSTLDEIEFIQKMVNGEIQIPEFHFAANYSAEEKLVSYISAMKFRKKWGKINNTIIERVCMILKEKLLTKDIIPSPNELLQQSYT